MANISFDEFLKHIKSPKGIQLTKEQRAFLDWFQNRKNKEIPFVHGRIKI